MIRRFFYIVCILLATSAFVEAQPSQSTANGKDADLKFVVYISRHGVRSPTGKAEQYNLYSTSLWPTWSVAPGYLTPHGYKLMELFGAYDRMELASQGLLNPTGCEDAAHVTIRADSDQRTRETGKAIAAGLFPGCKTTVQALPEGVNDPMFHFASAGLAKADPALEATAIAGRIGNNPDSLTEAYAARISELDQILATCGSPYVREEPRLSLLKIPARLVFGNNGHTVMRGPLNTAATLTENLLLEYVEGMDSSNVGWGCVDGAKLRSLLDLHTVASDFAQRTTPIAQMQASNLLSHVRKALEQGVTGKAVPGAPNPPTDRALFLIGHDTNLTNIAGLLNLTWIVDGRRDDTPPGGVLILELWKARASGDYFVQTYYSAQTLEQMRTASELTLEHPAQRVHLFLPGCSREDSSCTWSAFTKMLNLAIDQRYVSAR